MDEQLELIMRARDEMSGAVRTATENVRRETTRASRAMSIMGRASRAASAVVVSSFAAIKGAMTALIGMVGALMKALGPLLLLFTAGFSVVGAISSFKRLRSELDDLDKMAIRTGISVEALSRMDYVANLAGADLRTVTGAMERLNMQVVQGSRAFSQLGISTRNAGGEVKTAEELFLEVGAAIAAIEDPIRRSGVAMEVFGRSGTQILPLLLSDMQAATEEAERLGLVMTTEAATAAADLGDAMTRFGGALRGVQMQVQTNIMPSLTKMFNIFAEQIAANLDWIIRAMQNILPEVESVVGALGSAARMAAILKAAFTDLVGGIRILQTWFVEGAMAITLFAKHVQQAYRAIMIMLPTTTQAMRDELIETTRVAEWEIQTLERAVEALSGYFERVRRDAASAPGLFSAELRQTLQEIALWESTTKAHLGSVHDEAEAPVEMGLEKGMTRLQKVMQGIEDTWARVKDGFREGLEGMAVAAMDIGPKIARAMVGAFNSIEAAAVSSLEGFIEGSKSASEAVKDFARAFVSSLIRMVAQMLVAIPLAILFNVLTGGTLAALGASNTAGAMGTAGALSAGAMAQHGGGEQAFADGGVVRGPTRALIGEAGPEAVVPLPDGRSIPVEDRRGGNGAPGEVHLTFQVQALDAAGVDQLLMQRKELFKGIIAEAMGRDLGFRQTVRSV